MLGGGLIADRISRIRSVVWGRRLLGGRAYLVCGRVPVRWRCGPSHRPRSRPWRRCRRLCVQVALPTWWSAAIEQSGRHVGALFGLLNMMGTFGAPVRSGSSGRSPTGGKDLGYTGREQWDPMFNVYIIVLLIGSMTWLVYRKRPLE